MLTILMLLALAKTDTPAVQMVEAVQSEIQGRYEEIRQTQMQSTTSTDVDDLHDVLYTPDWTYVDKSGQTHTWAELRQHDIDALAHHPIGLYQPITRLTLSSDACTATVAITEYGVRYQDTWVKAGDNWKMKTRRLE